MRSNLQRLFSTLPPHLQEAATINGEDITLGQCEERRRDQRPTVTLTGVPGDYLVVTSGREPRLIKLHSAEGPVPAMLTNFAVDVGLHLRHDWARSRTWLGDGICVDRSWILATASEQMRPWLPGGTEIHDVLNWNTESHAWEFNWSTGTGRMEIGAGEHEDGYVTFSITVRRPNGNAFIVLGQYLDQKMVEVTGVTAGSEPIRKRHIVAATELLRALDPDGREDETWEEILLRRLSLPADLGDED